MHSFNKANRKLQTQNPKFFQISAEFPNLEILFDQLYFKLETRFQSSRNSLSQVRKRTRWSSRFSFRIFNFYIIDKWSTLKYCSWKYNYMYFLTAHILLEKRKVWVSVWFSANSARNVQNYVLCELTHSENWMNSIN